MPLGVGVLLPCARAAWAGTSPPPSLLANGGCFLPRHAVMFGLGETGCPSFKNFFAVKRFSNF